MPAKPILIVEDDQDIREMLQSLLEDEGYEVWTATNGRVALDLIRTRPSSPGLVLLDLMMPILDGAGFLREYAADSNLPPVPILMLTASHSPGTIEGVAGLIKKPLDLEHLLTSVERLILRNK